MNTPPSSNRFRNPATGGGAETDQPSCNDTNCGCGGINRRAVLKSIGASAIASLAPSLPAMAGPFSRNDFDKLVPADKKLSAEWIKSLFERGTPQVFRGAELELIGMPVGGICTGQLYLGGDGKLWHWDIFNQKISTGDAHYAKPMKPASPVEQGFAIRVNDMVHLLDRSGFSDIGFRGEYPIGLVEYKDAAVPVSVSMEAFSPFIPLNADDSSLPATVMRFTVRNTGAERIEAELAGWLENAVLLHNRHHTGLRRNTIMRGAGYSLLNCTVEKPAAPAQPARPDAVFEDWNKETYDGWTVAGTAFGTGPIRKSAIPAYQGDVGGDTERVVNSHATAPGGDIGAKDAATGMLTSKPFTIDRDFIQFWIGGGIHDGKTCLNLLVDGKVARTAKGAGDNRMSQQSFEVRDLQGKEAVLQIVDAQAGVWGNLGIGKITFSDTPPVGGKFEELPDFGTMGLVLLGDEPAGLALAAVPDGKLPDSIFAQPGNQAARPLAQRLTGALGRKLTLAPGAVATVTFVLVWNFPNARIDGLRDAGPRRYAKRFQDAAAVAEYVVRNLDPLATQTRLWRDTWYDSTLPYWFLDRTFLNTSILASSTCHWFANDRFYGWEGVGCCAGTCGHVWHYAQAMGRIFPQLERGMREKVDFGLAQQADGSIHFRAEHNNFPAIDAQAGTVLRTLREHQMSADDAFLKRVWPGVRKAIEWLIAKDADGDGLIVSGQHNTLDADWYGPVAWLSGLYVAALRAGEEMARELGETEFSKRCREIFERGKANLVAKLFDGGYFINQPDPKHPETINSGTGCHIDQVFGQGWAFQVGLGRVLPEKETVSALKSLWRYNFTPDVGPYRAANKPGRWYAMPGEGGLLMCTFPRTDWGYDKAKGKGAEWAAGYFNECMNGFEYQAAWHMIAEGMVMEGLAVTRMVHDRYHASRRNPWNEVECGDHYARSMASYGVFTAACGFEYHGPKGHIGFDPRLTPENFKAPFTGAEGWGTFSQKLEGGILKAVIELKHGRLRVKTIALTVQAAKSVVVLANGKPRAAAQAIEGQRLLITLAAEAGMRATDKLEITVS